MNYHSHLIETPPPQKNVENGKSVDGKTETPKLKAKENTNIIEFQRGKQRAPPRTLWTHARPRCINLYASVNHVAPNCQAANA